MPDFTPKYDAEQRQAIITAVVDEGIKLSRAIELASRGELDDGLEPFEIPYSSAYGIVTAERERRHANRTQQELIDDLWDRMLRRVTLELGKLTAKPKLTTTGISQLRSWVRLAREIDRWPKPSNGHHRKPQGAPQRSFIHDLAEQAAAEAAAAQEETTEPEISPPAEPSTPDHSPDITDAQREAAQAILTAGRSLAAPSG